MIHAFEIYTNILSHSLMPWLKKNKDMERFESFIILMGYAFKARPCDFFRAAPAAARLAGLTFNQHILHECRLFSKIPPDHAGHPIANSICRLPADSARECFYNRLTGCSLSALAYIIHAILEYAHGKDISVYYHGHLKNHIHSLLCLPLPAVSRKSPGDLMILLKVKLSLAVLLDMLQEAGEGVQASFSSNPGGIRFFKGLIRQENIGRLARKSLLDLLEERETEKAPGKFYPSDTLSDRMQEGFSMPGKEGQETKLLEMLREMQEDLRATKAAFGKLQPVKEPEKNAEGRMIGSGEVMRLMGISAATLKRYRDNGKIQYKRFGGKFLYAEEYIKRLLKP